MKPHSRIVKVPNLPKRAKNRVLEKNPMIYKQSPGCSVKTLFLNISQNSQENSCAGLFFNKVSDDEHDNTSHPD